MLRHLALSELILAAVLGLFAIAAARAGDSRADRRCVCPGVIAQAFAEHGAGREAPVPWR